MRRSDRGWMINRVMLAGLAAAMLLMVGCADQTAVESGTAGQAADTGSSQADTDSTGSQGTDDGSNADGQTEETLPTDEGDGTDSQNQGAAEGESESADAAESGEEATEDTSNWPEFAHVNEFLLLTGNVNVHTVPVANSTVAMILMKDTVVKVTGHATDWSQISYKGQTYYIQTRYLRNLLEDETIPESAIEEYSRWDAGIFDESTDGTDLTPGDY